VLVIVLAGPWMLNSLLSFTTQLFAGIAEIR
jgi:flagellar biosynthesis protein FliQ